MPTIVHLRHRIHDARTLQRSNYSPEHRDHGNVEHEDIMMPRSRKLRPIHRGPSAPSPHREARRRALRRLAVEPLERRMLLAAVTGVDPLANSITAPTSTAIVATFDEVITGATATAQNFAVHSMQRGQLSGGAATVTAAGQTITFDPTSDFFPGENVQVTATAAIQGAATAVVPEVWHFRTAVNAGSGQFLDTGQNITPSADSAASGDLDGDGDLDIFLGGPSNSVWFNDGSGILSNAQSNLGSSITRGVEVGDLDGDGDLDAFAANQGTANVVWMNNGSGQFNSGQTLGNSGSYDVSLGDIDGDGDLDAFVANSFQANRVWVNNGSGAFSDSGQALGNFGSLGVELGDLDGDGDLDAFVANAFAGDRVWANNGAGVFTNSGQALGNHNSQDVSLGDLDGDGDLDAFVTHYAQGSRVWSNDGGGNFSNSGPLPGNLRGRGTSLGDLDGDGDLDAYVSNDFPHGNLVWENDGSGGFTDSGQSLNGHRSYHATLGDLDGDGDLDIFSANRGEYSSVYLNQNLQPSAALSIDNLTAVEAGGEATVTATLSSAHSVAVTLVLGISGTATTTDDYTISATEIVIPIGATTGSVTITAVQDTVDEPDETVIVDITAATNAQEAGTQQVTTTILDDDEPPMPNVTLSLDHSDIAEAAGVATFTVTLSETTTVPVTVDLGISGTAAATDYAASATQVEIAAGATTGSVTVTAVQDEVNEPDETVIVDITSVTNGNEDGDQQQTTTILDDDIPPSFAVTSLDSNGSGFQLEFTSSIDASEINIYDTQNAGFGAADVVVTGATSGPVTGSVIVGDSSVTFIKTGDPLAADTYTVTLRSAADGFKDTDGMLLDGDGDGTGGDDYSDSFAIDEVAGARTVSIPDFVRGPGQDVNLPADATTGIPISISDGENVRAADVRIAYDPARLEITGATAPAGGSVILNTTTTPGVAILVFFSSASLPAGTSTFINLEATIPAENASANYRGQQLLDLHAVTIGDGNDNEFPVTVDDALHFSTYFSDVSGNGRVNASDAAQVARFAALIDNGFAGSLVTDPILVGDISGNGRLNAADASLVARFAALIPVDQIPPIPGGIAISGVLAPANEDAAPPDVDGLARVSLRSQADAISANDGLGFAEYLATLEVIAPTDADPNEELEYGNGSDVCGDLGEDELIDEELVHGLAIDSLGSGG